MPRDLRSRSGQLPSEADRLSPGTPAGSAPLGIASITAVLRDLLANGVIRQSQLTRLGDVTVSVLPPDRITVGTDEPNQLNLFMYRVTSHSTYRDGAGQRPGVVAGRRGRLSLNLHYLLTAYGSQDFHSEILLGCAIHLLSRTPVLNAEIVRAALQVPVNKGDNPTMPPIREALALWGAEQVEEIKITPQFLSFEDSSKLWSMLQAKYRPSVTYEVSAVIVGEA